MKETTIGYLISTIICLLAALLVIYKAIRHPNRLRLFIITYTLFTLPASIVNTLTAEGITSQRSNCILYLVATFLMLLSHIYMLLDMGYRLRSSESPWKHPLVLASLILLSSALAILISQIIVLCRKPDWSYPLKGTFIAGIVVSILSVMCIFTYTFMPLVYWRKDRKTLGYSRTTALGIWFFTVQSVWFALYGILYIWFFIADTWDYWQILLSFDYTLCYFQNLIYSWPPPAYIIDFLTDQLITTMTNYGPSRDINNTTIAMNSELYTQSGNNTEVQAKRSEFIGKSGDAPYGSKAAIISREDSSAYI